MSPNDSPNGRPTKRKKPLSCGECRRLKLKCELKFPCAHCVKRGLASICPEGRLVNGSRRTKILESTEDLHTRIAALEEALKAATSSSHPLLGDALYANRDDVVNNGRRGTPSNASVAQSNGAARSPSTSPQAPQPPLLEHAVFGLDPAASGYYSQAAAAIGGNGLATPLLTSPLDVTSLYPCQLPAGLDASSIARSALPAFEAATALEESYFETFGWCNQILQRRLFDDEIVPEVYPAVAGSMIAPQKLALALLTYALGALMDLTKPAFNDTATELFNAARLALSLDPTHSITYVQCIYLYVQFLMNSKKDTTNINDECWPLLRMGLAVAEAISLHRDGPNILLGVEHAMERRSVFWEMRTLDMQLSINLGRGAGISDYSIDCKMPDATCPDLLFHCKSYALTKLLTKVNISLVSTRPSTYTEVLDIDRALDDFQRSLPAQFHPGRAPSLLEMSDPARRKATFQRNRMLLHINEAKLALHRVWFMSILEEVPIEPLSCPLRESYLSCLEACREIVTLVRHILSLQGQHVHRQWHYFSHLFSACICLAASTIRAPSSSLAKAVLTELESGIMLFQMADRDEANTLTRLRDKAVQAIAAGQAAKVPDAEDLDLLGARTFVQSIANRTAQHSSSRPQQPLPARPWGILNSSDGQLPLAADVFNPNMIPVNAQGLPEWPSFEMDQFLNDLGPVPWE